MSNETKHTPTPWIADWSTRTNNGPKQGWFVEAESADDRDTWGVIASLPDGRDNTEANAQFIARACNAHEDLLTALLRIANSEPRPKRNGDFDATDIEYLQRIARIAITKAEGRA